MTSDTTQQSGGGNLVLARRLARVVHMQETLAEVSRRIGPAQDLQHVLETVLNAMAELVEFKGGSICLVEGDQIRLAHSRPAVSDEVKAARLRIGEGLSGRIVATGDPIMTDDITTDSRAALQSVGSNATIRSYIGVPLVCLSSVVGLLQVDSAAIGAFDEDDLLMLRGLAAQVAGSIESARRQEEQLRFHELKTDFIARVSHELRTPVTIVSGFASTLAEHGTELDPEQLHEFMERLVSASLRLSRLVNDVVAISALEAGVSPPRASRLSVKEVLAHLIEGDGEGNLIDEIPASLEARTDRVILQRVVAPLIDNVRTHATGGRVTAGRRGDRITIDVIDEGPGVADDLRGRLFERFTRSDHTGAGMGLGLAIANTLAGTAGGRVTYHPHGQGSRFRVVLPDLHVIED